MLCLPGLLLPKKQAMWIIKFFVCSLYFYEKHIIGLDYEVRGTENLPKDGSFIVASKHQSAYETLKLFFLFNDPSIVLKKELLSIPLWGWFLAKIDPIAINRKQFKKSLNQIAEGANRMKAQGRPIIVFPQGTRVSITDTPNEKPYKIGVARAAEGANLTIIPMALNSGVFWPRKSWIKKPGTVVFEFLPPVSEGLGMYEILRDIESRIEDHSNKLVAEAQQKQ